MTQRDPFFELKQGIGAAHSQSRQALGEATKASAKGDALQQELRQQAQALRELRDAISRVQIVGGQTPDIQRIENIPGRRLPFDMLVDIPIGANVSAVQQGTITIPQNGPFVAVARFATFLSQFQFQRTDPISGAQTTFNGRSFGRYRAIHSAWDLNDGRPITEVQQILAFPGTGAGHIISPSNESSFRSMQTDFRVRFLSAGDGYPRSNQEVPSTFWTKQINSPFDLGALDFFERGNVLTFNVLPTHVNNPSFGNVSTFGIPNPNYPFLGSQWDGVEGILDPDDPNANDQDPIVRAPNGVLTIGFHGFLIVQPPGAGYI